MEKKLIPRFEPEVIAAGTRKHHGDDEKVATTTFEGVLADDILVTSRYKKADEIELMVEMVDALPDEGRRMVRSIFCDSKAQHCYTIELTPAATIFDAERIAGMFETVCFGSKPGGHNGMYFEGSFGRLDVDPDWREFQGQ